MDSSTPPLWGAQLWGTAPHREDVALWKLSWYSYGDSPPFADVPWDRSDQPELPTGWKRIPDQALGPYGLSAERVHDRDTGLRAMVFEDSAGHTVLAFRGSNDGPDWTANAQQALGHDTAQYDQAMQMAVDLTKAVGANVAFTGHSLGGGLASAAALATGRVAVTFDAAGLHPHTEADAVGLRSDGVDVDEALKCALSGQIRAYHTDIDVLTAVQQSDLKQAPPALGTEIVLRVPHDRASRRWHQVGAQVGPALGGVVGGVVSGSPIGVGVGALAGAAVGGQLSTGFYGHFYGAINDSLKALFEEQDGKSSIDKASTDKPSTDKASTDKAPTEAS